MLKYFSRNDDNSTLTFDLDDYWSKNARDVSSIAHLLEQKNLLTTRAMNSYTNFEPSHALEHINARKRKAWKFSIISVLKG